MGLKYIILNHTKKHCTNTNSASKRNTDRTSNQIVRHHTSQVVHYGETSGKDEIRFLVNEMTN